MSNSLSRAILLGGYALFWNDPNLINTYVDRINAVKPADVQGAAAKYLVTTNRTVVVTMPKAAGGSPTEGGR